MDDAVRKLAADSGVLRTIAGQRQPAGYELLELSFDHGLLRLACHVDTDEIIVTGHPSSSSATGLAAVVDDPELTSLRGKVIELAWSLSNHRGYSDAFQIRCLDLATRDESCCQFEVAASAITVARVL